MASNCGRVAFQKKLNNSITSASHQISVLANINAKLSKASTLAIRMISIERRVTSASQPQIYGAINLVAGKIATSAPMAKLL